MLQDDKSAIGNDVDIEDEDTEVEVTPPKQDDDVERPKSPRQIAMEAIEASRDKELEEEGIPPEEEEPAPSKEKEPQQKQEQEQTEEGEDGGAARTEPEAAPTAPAQKEEPQPRYADPNELKNLRFRAKIDGEEVDYSLEQIVRNAQKNDAATRRLEEANRTLEEARALLASAKEKPAAAAEQQADTKEEPTEQDDTAGDSELNEFIEAIYNAESDKAKQTLRKVMRSMNKPATGHGDQPRPNEQQIIAEVTQQVKQQMSYETALAKFASDYPEIDSDPHLASITRQFLDANLKAGTPYVEALEESGKQTRAWVKKFVPETREQPKPPTDQRNDRLSRKAQLDNIPTASATAAAPEEQDDPHNDIAEMRKRRGYM